MTHEQQLQQLLTEAEAVTTKMREALAKMEVPTQWTPKKGDWAEVKGCSILYNDGDIVQVDEDDNISPLCILPIGERWAIDIDKLRHLPDYQPKPKLATTYAEVVEAVKPKWECMYDLELFKYEGHDKGQLPTEAVAKQDAAFRQIKNLEAYCADKFEGERNCSIKVHNCGTLGINYTTYQPFKFTKEAADFVIKHFPEIFKQYYGVE